MSYIDNDKIKIASLKGLASNYIYDKTDKLQVFFDFIEIHSERIKEISLAILTLLSIGIIIFNLESVRVPRYLGKMIQSNKKNPILSNSDYLNKEYRLCDFYVASAYKCYLPCTYYYDYSSTEAIIKCISSGARYLHFDIFPDNKLSSGGLRRDADPVVCNGIEKGNWHTTTTITFDEVCKLVNIYGLGNAAPNSQNVVTTENTNNIIMNAKDPLFIHLSLKCAGQIDVIDKCADLLIRYFGVNLLASGANFKYAYCGTQSNTNIALTTIDELLGRVIIICDAENIDDIRNSKIFEITNISPNFAGTCRMNTYEKIRDAYDLSELSEYNKQNLTIVRPTEYGRDKSNYNFYTPWYLGCQFISLNFTLNDAFINNYLKLDNRFGKYSFMLKPTELRYKPKTIDPPIKQNPKVTFKPRQICTPFGCITA
jgi:hypothetical protein